MSRVNLEDPLIFDPTIKKGLKHGLNALADANATLTKDSGPVVFMTPSAGRNITLPVVTPDMKGLTFYVITQAAFALTVKNQATTNVGIVPATIGATGMFVCLGDSTLGIGGWIGGL